MKPYLVAASARWFSLLLLTLALATLHAGPLPNPTPRENFWVTDGTVLSLLEHNGQLYVGGAFSSVGPNTGKGAIFSNAQSTPNLNWPKLRPRVHAAVGDGNGGWYVGGAQYNDHLAGNAVRYLFTHLTNDRTIDTEFETNFRLGGQVYALLCDGNTLYVGGNFIDIGGASRGYVAAIDLNTGQVKAWNPDLNLYVRALAKSGNTLYVGGDFTQAGGADRPGLAAVDVTSGNVLPFPEVGIGESVNALLVSGNTLYVGGQFSTIGGKSRHNLAAINLANGTVISGFDAGTFTTEPNVAVSSLAIASGKLYVGGNFDSIGGTSVLSLAVLNPSTGENQEVDFDIKFHLTSGYVSTLTTIGPILYVGGFFTEVADEERYHLAAIDTATDKITPWSVRVAKGPENDRLVDVVATDGNDLFVGGNFNTIGAVARNNMASFYVSTGEATDWNPDVSGVVSAIVNHGDHIYIGGDFSKVGGAFRDFIAGFNEEGDLLPFSSDFASLAFNGVHTLLVDGDFLYAGGAFVITDTQGNLGRYDLTDGSLTSWNPGPAGPVRALVKDGSTLYVGGEFTSIGGQSRNSIAALDISTGNATSWNPDSSNGIYSLAVGPSVVYASGNFSTIGGAERYGLAAIDKTTGLATAWNPNPSSSGTRLVELSDSHLLIGGGPVFNFFGHQIANFAVLDTIAGSPRSLDLDIHPSSIFAIHRGQHHYYIGGNQDGSRGEVRPTLSVHRLAPFLHKPQPQGDGSITLYMDLITDFSYTLQYTTDFGSWFNVGSLNNHTSLNDAGSIGQPFRYYRIVESR